jgi:D-xylose transport system ATP-binding protein
VLELRSITKDFPGVRALSEVSFDLREGEIHAICGENGAGKSTLIKVLCGYHPHGTYAGEIRIGGRPVRMRGLRDAERHGIALIAQELALCPQLSVTENLLLGCEPTRLGLIDWARARDEAARAVARVGLAVDPDQRVGELGIGQQQLLEIARALRKAAAILVLDEPTAALTEADTKNLQDLLLSLRGRGVSSIYISHRLEEVFAIADRITVLRDGRAVATAPARELTRDQVITHMVGRDFVGTELAFSPRRRRGESLNSVPGDPLLPLLEVRNLTVREPQAPRPAVTDVSFTLHAGEVLGVAGLLGAGRTALLSALFGAARGPVAGQVRVAGREGDRPFSTPAQAIAAGVALLSEDRKRFGLVLDATVGENLTLAVLRRLTRHGLIDRRRRDQAAAEQVQALRIRLSGLDQPVRQLSGGNQQKVVLGRWLLTRPRVLLLDEPTRGVDVGAKAEIHRLIAALAADGLGVLLCSSDLPELLGMSHRVLVLAAGHLTACLGAAAATPEAVMAAAIPTEVP